jgi:alkanesulfonate monooxygenase SsuD/methylene tetrahydromethanopterin reductase-like flavin-dependent oxidoreductase (luciferase family)
MVIAAGSQIHSAELPPTLADFLVHDVGPIGGMGPKAIERTIKYGDGYYPIGLQSGELARIATHLKEESEKHDRSMPDLIVGGMIREGSPEPMIDRISAMQEAGANYYILGLGRYPDADIFRRGIERFATEVMPKIS